MNNKVAPITIGFSFVELEKKGPLVSHLPWMYAFVPKTDISVVRPSAMVPKGTDDEAVVIRSQPNEKPKAKRKGKI